jgi:hypothetical protein
LLRDEFLWIGINAAELWRERSSEPADLKLGEVSIMAETTETTADTGRDPELEALLRDPLLAEVVRFVRECRKRGVDPTALAREAEARRQAVNNQSGPG